MKDRRGALVGAVAGLVLLLGMVAFAVGLPELSGSGEGSDAAAGEDVGSAATGTVALPDELDGGLVAQDSGEIPVPQGVDEEQFQQQLADFQTNARERLSELFGAAASFRVYASVDGSKQALVTVLDEAPGLFAPDGPPVDPDLAQVARPATELVAEGDAVCALNWGQAVPAGQPVPEGPPLLARCQLGAGDRTYEMAGSGMTPAEIVGLLEGLTEQT